MRYVIAVVAVCGLLAGCGGGSSTKTVTVTPASSGSSAPATTTESQQQALDDYLNKLKPYRDKANSAVNEAKPALNEFSNDPTQDNANAAADKLDAAAKVLQDNAAQVAAVVPPPGLDGSEFAQGFQDEANNLKSLADDVRKMRVSGIQEDVSQLDATKAELVRWKVKVIQFASAHGLTYDKWVEKVGTSH